MFEVIYAVKEIMTESLTESLKKFLQIHFAEFPMESIEKLSKEFVMAYLYECLEESLKEYLKKPLVEFLKKFLEQYLKKALEILGKKSRRILFKPFLRNSQRNLK